MYHIDIGNALSHSGGEVKGNKGAQEFQDPHNHLLSLSG